MAKQHFIKRTLGTEGIDFVGVATVTNWCPIKTAGDLWCPLRSDTVECYGPGVTKNKRVPDGCPLLKGPVVIRFEVTERR